MLEGKTQRAVVKQQEKTKRLQIKVNAPQKPGLLSWLWGGACSGLYVFFKPIIDPFLGVMWVVRWGLYLAIAVGAVIVIRIAASWWPRARPPAAGYYCAPLKVFDGQEVAQAGETFRSGQ